MLPPVPALTALVLLAGCGNLVDLPEAGPPLPLVEGLLIADSAAATFRLVWTDPPGTDPAVAPIPPGQVALALTGPGGRAPLEPVADSAGYFRARLPIERGGSYRLEGTIADRPVRAQVTVPARFDLRAPAEPIAIARDGFTPVAYRFDADGAAAFMATGARFRSTFSVSTRAPSGELFVDPPAPGAEQSTVVLFAITREADQYLFSRPTARSNVAGGFGYLGGAISLTREVRWQ